MKVFEKSIGARDAVLTCCVQDVTGELPALENCPAVLILPGGAYAYCSGREAEPVALAYMNMGFNAFVLRYSTSSCCPSDVVFQNALAEAEESLEYLRENAKELHIEASQIATVGFSAGGHLAAALGTMGKVRPNALVLGYAAFQMPMENLGISDLNLIERVDDKTPPTFLFATQGDRLVPAEGSLEFALRLGKQKIPYETHVFAYGDHGASLGTETVANASTPANKDVTGWVEMSVTFMKHIFNGDALIPVREEVTEYGLDMKISRLLTDEKCSHIVVQLLPELKEVYDKQQSTGTISLRSLQRYSNNMFNVNKLNELEITLQKLNQ